MNEHSDYGKKWAIRRLSRRRMLTGAAGVGSGLAALSLVGCGGGGEETPTASPAASPGASPASSPAATPTGSVYHRWGAGPGPALEPAGARGGTLRWFSFAPMVPDTFDPHQTQFGPIAGMHSSVFSKVLKYTDPYYGVIEPDLAEALPEMPDKLTYLLKIRPGVRFHNTEKMHKQFPDVAGRELTAEDVKYNIERQMNKQSPRSALYYRMSEWETIDKIELVDPLTLRITTKRPTVPFLHYLADYHNFVIAKELVNPQTDDMNSVDKMIGTGPFMLDKFVSLQTLGVLRNPDWFAKDDLAAQGFADRPIVDGFEAIWMPADDTSIEIAFTGKQIDQTGYVDNGAPDRVAPETGALTDEWLSSAWINTRLLITDSPAAKTPFKDLRLRQAINMAVDRSRMSQQVYQGFSQLVSPVSQALGDWGLPLDELSKRPGYRFKREEREEDLAEARQMWEAAGGPSIGSLEVNYPAIPDVVKTFWPQFQRNLKEALNFDVEGRLDATGYTEIAQGLLQKRLVFIFGYDNGWFEPDDFLYPYFHSTGSKNSFGLSDSTLDSMLEQQREEFDRERRRELVHDIQRYLLDNVVCRLDFVSEIDRGTRWPYFKNKRFGPWYGDFYWMAEAWLDSSDPTFEGRPA